MFLPAHIKNDGLVVLVCWDWDHWRLRIVPENLVFSINTAFINIIIILIYQIWRTNTYNHKSPVHCNTRVSPMFKPKRNICWVLCLSFFTNAILFIKFLFLLWEACKKHEILAIFQLGNTFQVLRSNFVHHHFFSPKNIDSTS